MKHILLISVIMALLVLPAVAEVSPDISIQGVLTDNAGVPLPDDEYQVTFRFYDAPTGGTHFQTELGDVNQTNGAFNFIWESLYPDMFDHDLWLELTLDGESPMTPRIALTPVPVALWAKQVDPSRVVTRLDGLRGDIDLIGGANVTLTQGAGSITISAIAGAGGDDGDWTISGGDLFHSGYGTVAIGTSTPAPLYAGFGTTFQINSYAMPTLCLDRTVGDFERWAMYNAGSGGLRIGRTEVADIFPISGMEIFDTKTEFLDHNGDVKIKMQTNDSMEVGSVIYMYGTTTAAPTLVLDGQLNNDGGGNIVVRDGSGNDEVVITGNHNGTSIGRITTPVLQITGGSDLSEQFDIGNTSLLLKPGMVVSIDPDKPGSLTLCEGAYNRRVAGVISGAGGVNTGMLMGQAGSQADGDHAVALVGRVYVWADASAGPIEPGDLLTSSDRPGHAMKVEDHGRAMGAILGKAMTGLAEGQGLILTLVSLQ